MTDKGGHAKQIAELVREPSARKRREGLSALARTFRTAPRGPLRAVTELGEALAGVLPELTEDDRKYLAEQLAACGAAPTYLIRKLAADRPEIAAAVLAATTVLEDSDLIAAAELGGTERLIALAQRPALPNALEVALIKSGDAAALRVLAARTDTHHPQAVAQACLRAAKKSPGLAADLLKRGTLPPALLGDLFFDVAGADRLDLIAKMTGIPAPAPGRSDPVVIDELLSHLRAGKRGPFARVLARLSAVPPDIIDRAIEDATCETMAVLCLGSGLGRAVYSSYVILTRPENPDAQARLPALLAIADHVPPAGAAALVAQWRAKGPAAAARKALSTKASATSALPPPPIPGSTKGKTAGLHS